MNNIEHYRRKLRGTDRAKFIAEHPHWFLIKRPRVVSIGAETEPPPLNTYMTPADSSVDGWFGEQWMVAEVRRRSDNPFTEMISIGRAMNCDVVLLFPGVSKLHGHFWIEDGVVAKFSDEGSRHGSALNGVKLAKQSPQPVKLGDVIRFGSHIELMLCDVKGLLGMLDQTEKPTPRVSAGS